MENIKTARSVRGLSDDNAGLEKKSSIQSVSFSSRSKSNHNATERRDVMAIAIHTSITYLGSLQYKVV